MPTPDSGGETTRSTGDVVEADSSTIVFGERIWTEADRSSFPAEFRSSVPTVSTVIQLIGIALLTYGLVVLDPVATVAGIMIAQVAKLWFLDRMVLLYDAMKRTNPEYAAWER